MGENVDAIVAELNGGKDASTFKAAAEGGVKYEWESKEKNAYVKKSAKNLIAGHGYICVSPSTNPLRYTG